MTMMNEGPHLDNRRGASDPNQHDGSGGDRDGRGGVHGDAERAVVCRVDIGMDVRDLNDGK